MLSRSTIFDWGLVFVFPSASDYLYFSFLFVSPLRPKQSAPVEHHFNFSSEQYKKKAATFSLRLYLVVIIDKLLPFRIFPPLLVSLPHFFYCLESCYPSLSSPALFTQVISRVLLNITLHLSSAAQWLVMKQRRKRFMQTRLLIEGRSKVKTSESLHAYLRFSFRKSNGIQ